MDTIIYGMGGGKMSDPRMTDHYQRIVDLAKTQFGIETPQVAIIPTAQFNGTHAKIGRGNMDFIDERFRNLGCDTQQILMGDVPAGESETRDRDIQDILRNAHAVFVLGGDTRYLLEVVRGKGTCCDRRIDAPRRQGHGRNKRRLYLAHETLHE
jgi:peptidase E